MSDPQLDSLLYPLETRGLNLRGRFLCFGIPRVLPGLAAFAEGVTYVQPYRPDYLALERAGCTVIPRAESSGYDAAFIRLGRFRGLNEHWIAQAVRRTRAAGHVVCAGARMEGAASARKRLARQVPELFHAAMRHGETFWFEVPADGEALAARLEPPEPGLVEGRFRTAPGMFSHRGADAGSMLLAKALPADLSGAVADFGAGWGYLSAAVADRCARVELLDLYEADYEALDAARGNVVGRAGLELAFFWHDLLGEPVSRKYSAIVMNPPFHAGRKADPGIGQAMIGRAAAALSGGGRLILVANRGLPYRKILEANFSRLQELASDAGFEVVIARR